MTGVLFYIPDTQYNFWERLHISIYDVCYDISVGRIYSCTYYYDSRYWNMYFVPARTMHFDFDDNTEMLHLKIMKAGVMTLHVLLMCTRGW